MKENIPIRIVLVNPSINVSYAVQFGKEGRLAPVRSDGSDLSFDLNLTVSGQLDSGAPRFLGDFVHGPPQERFVYITIGTSAGDPTSPWTRRAKIHLSEITSEMVAAVQASPGSVIEGRFPGRDKKGEPACASLRPSEGGWQLKN